MLYKLSKLKYLVIIPALFVAINGFALNTQAQRKKPPKRERPTSEKFILAAPAVSETIPAISDENLTPEQKLRLETFRVVWRTIYENYFDTTFSGLDWKKIKAEYEPQVVKLETDEQLHDLLQKMIDRLNRSHFSIIPPDVVNALENARLAAKSRALAGEPDSGDEDGEIEDGESLFEEEDWDATYGIGVELRLLDEQFVITRVEKNSAAEKAGLKIGFVIEKINSFSLGEILEAVKKEKTAQNYLKQLPLIVESYFLNGEADDPVFLTYLDAENQSTEVMIEREKLSGETVKILTNMPPQFVRFEAFPLDEKTGYIKFNYFAVSLIDKFCGAVGRFKDKENLVIDLRGNMGGSLGTIWGIGSVLTDAPLKLGTEIYRNRQEDRYIAPQKKNFKGRIVVLVDGLSFSAAEMFAAALQENGRASVVGVTSAGEALPSITTVLPTGAVFLYPIANFKTPKGNLLEGNGVKPDLNVELERKTLLVGVDKQIDSALAFLKIPPAPKAAPEGSGPMARTTKPPPPPPPPPAAVKNLVKETPITEIKQDKEALRVIDEFVEAVGGREKLEKIESYSAGGTAILSQSGTQVIGVIEIYRDSPNKLAEIYNLEGIGRMSEVFDGKEFFTQSTIFGTKTDAPPVYLRERKLFAEFNEILKMRELYPQINYLGKYDREGTDAHLVEAVSKDGAKIIFTFEDESKMLVFRSGTYGDTTFGDYRKVGDVLFPFYQTRSGIFEFKLTDVKVNEKIDESVFLPEESCFDKTD